VSRFLNYLLDKNGFNRYEYTATNNAGAPNRIEHCEIYVENLDFECKTKYLLTDKEILSRVSASVPHGFTAAVKGLVCTKDYCIYSIAVVPKSKSDNREAYKYV